MTSRAGTSLRARWTRAFTVLTVILVLGGVGTFLFTRLLVSEFRESAVSIERQSALSATVRNGLVAHAVTITSAATADQRLAVAKLQSSITKNFGQLIKAERHDGPRALLRNGLGEWNAFVVAAAAGDGDPAKVGAEVIGRVPKILNFVDSAALADRVAVRASWREPPM